VIPPADTASMIAPLLGVALVVGGLGAMVWAVRERSTPASLLGVVLIAFGAFLVLHS
jgi:uncharacterized membrane protein HdeD (DUF308 family)